MQEDEDFSKQIHDRMLQDVTKPPYYEGPCTLIYFPSNKGKPTVKLVANDMLSTITNPVDRGPYKTLHQYDIPLEECDLGLEMLMKLYPYPPKEQKK